MSDTSVTIYALNRVLFHLSEPQQAEMPRYRTHNGCFAARAAARVIVKRTLRAAEVTVASQWDDLKGGELDGN
jgi:hypothetical protein